MVTLQQPVQTGERTWKLSYSSSLENPTFYIWIDGSLAAVTQQTEYTMAVNPGESVVVEVLDDADAEPMQVFPGKIRLGWFASEGTDHYKVEEYVASQWVQRTLMPDNGGYMAWESRFLEDGASHTFRVTPVGADGNEGTAKQFAVLMVRHPDVPAVTYSYAAGTAKVTITEVS